MKIHRTGYLYQGKTLVLNKDDIANSKDDDFKEISMFLDINELAKILEKHYVLGNKETKEIYKNYKEDKDE